MVNENKTDHEIKEAEYIKELEEKESLEIDHGKSHLTQIIFGPYCHDKHINLWQNYQQHQPQQHGSYKYHKSPSDILLFHLFTLSWGKVIAEPEFQPASILSPILI